MSIYFNAQLHLYALSTCYSTRNVSYKEELKPLAVLLLTPTDFVDGTFGQTVLSLNNIVITSFARCYPVHLHIFYHAAYQIQNNQIPWKGGKMWVSNLLLLPTYATSKADGIVFLGRLRTLECLVSVASGDQLLNTLHRSLASAFLNG